MLKKKPSFEALEKIMNSLGEPDKKPAVVPAADPEGNLPWLKYVAMLTGALAALAGFLVVRSANLTNQAIFESNQAILAQAEASDSWAEYQADSIKAHIVETQLLPSSLLSIEDRATLTKTDEELRARQPQSKQTANAKTLERDGHMKETQKRMDQKDLLEYAGLAVQMGIVLASVAAMVKRRMALHAGIAAGIIGVAITAYALLSSFLGL
jgi:hypothetical protein